MKKKKKLQPVRFDFPANANRSNEVEAEELVQQGELQPPTDKRQRETHYFTLFSSSALISGWGVDCETEPPTGASATPRGHAL